ncbi:hypothetical protein [Salinicola rhizosphaerae]|uniref:DUF883 domain-containing protein n=1 Tax=Salinicola rhizosphaerae TaxID=1443141 RepID=A0ABQ3EBI2_9GAMM|nr:hypothetical protein [Salinicola rhizosphaerae]GHB29508.1 hypothetical protein GCM10009038_30200 [Salinicola rhizosphaerae]
MSLFHRDDKQSQVNRIEEDLTGPSTEPSSVSPASAGTVTEPLEESIDEAPAAARYYLEAGDWATRSRRRLDEQITDTCQSCDTFVRRKPWKSVGIAALGGAVLALMVTRQ